MAITEWSIMPTMSLPLIMRFSLSNEDLITAYNAQLDHICKPLVRHIIVTIGFLLIIIPLLSLFSHIHERFGLVGTVCLILGVILLRAWFVVPVIRRFKIRHESGAVKMIRLIIDEETITEESGDIPKDVRSWTEINRIIENPKGFIIYYHDGPLMWLPTRVFEGRDALEEFLSLAGRKHKL